MVWALEYQGPLWGWYDWRSKQARICIWLQYDWDKISHRPLLDTPTFVVHSSGKMNGNLASTSIQFFAIFSNVFVQNKYQLIWFFKYYFMYWYSILDYLSSVLSIKIFIFKMPCLEAKGRLMKYIPKLVWKFHKNALKKNPMLCKYLIFINNF